jgi:hypothetical protein
MVNKNWIWEIFDIAANQSTRILVLERPTEKSLNVVERTSGSRILEIALNNIHSLLELMINK